MSGTRSLVTAAAVVVLVYGIQAAQQVLVPFLTAVFLAVIVARPVFWLDRRGLPHVVSVTAVMILLAGTAVLVAAYVGTEITEFTGRLPAYQESLSESLSALVSRFSSRRIPVRVEELMGEIEPGQAMRYTAMILNGLKDVFANAVLIAFTIVFILLEIPRMPRRLSRVVPSSDATLRRFRTFADGLQRYLNLKTLISLATGLCAGVWVAILGVDFPILWGMLAFLLNYIPNIGSLIAAVPPILMGFIQYGLGRAVMVAIGYLVVNMTFGNVVEPRVMGRGLGLSTLVVWLSLIVWGWALGPVGMLLSVPLTMTIKIALDSSRKTRRWAVLLKSDDAIEAEPPASASP